MNFPISVGLIGIGGYGHSHLSTLLSLQEAGVCILRAIADPFAGRNPAVVAALQAQGIAIYDEARELCERDDIEVVFIATPISLHAPQGLMALQSGKHVYLEKPPCVTLEEHAQLMAACKASGNVCAVGFQQQASSVVQFAKRELLRGVLGKPQTISASIRWSRDDAYYSRAPWAGRWRIDGQPVFDGPATNALSHVVQASLFLAGETQRDAANILRVRGCLKKARPIESYDSIYLEAQTTGGVTVRLALIHATSLHDEVLIRCTGEEGSLSLGWTGRAVHQNKNGQVQEYQFPGVPQLTSMMNFLRAVRQPEYAPTTSLENTLAYLQVSNGALQSSMIAQIPNFDEVTITKVGSEPDGVFTVAGLDEQLAVFAQDETAPPPLLPPGDWVEASEISPTLIV